MMNHIFREINQIIERDSKDTSYKFALLRGTIEIIQSRSPYIEDFGDRMRMPIGLMVERWLMYYFPFVAAEEFIPQKNGEKDRPGVRLAFRPHMRKVTDFYRQKGGFSAFFHDLHFKGIPHEIRDEFLKLCRKIAHTITEMPMKYIGYSVFAEHGVLYRSYKLKYKKPKGEINLQAIINLYGTFTIPLDYFDVFSFLGSYISGMEGLLMQWAEFTYNVSKKEVSRERALDFLLTQPISERDIQPAGSFYRNFQTEPEGLTCVWTGKRLNRNFEVDHLIPFSVWKNNNLWNLLPSSREANNQKRDKIPSVELLDLQKEHIIFYWNKLSVLYPSRFQTEVKLSLLGTNVLPDDWSTQAYASLTKNCIYLSEERGYEIWNGPKGV